MKFFPEAHRRPELGAIYLKYKGVRALVEQVRLKLLTVSFVLTISRMPALALGCALLGVLLMDCVKVKMFS